MIHVVLDTSIFSADKKRSKGPFRALTRLLQGNMVHLHVPYIVKHEFISQQKSALRGHIHEIRDAAARIKDESSDPMLMSYAETCDTRGLELRSKASEYIECEFSQWLEKCNASIHRCGRDHAQQIVEEYFEGVAPFKQAKNRQDFPDAFIWHSVLEILNEFPTLHFVSSDKTMYNTAVKKGIASYETLEEFIESSECKSSLLSITDAIVGANTIRIASLIQRKHEGVDQMVRRDLARLLQGQVVSGDTILGVRREAIIQAVKTIHDVVVEFERSEYYGDAEIGLPFTAFVTCSLRYHVNPILHVFGERDRNTKVKIVDFAENTTIFEQEFQVMASGILSVSFNGEAAAQEHLSDDELFLRIPTEGYALDIVEINVIGPS